MTNYDKIPNELRALKQWVCAWKDSKTPMRAWEYKGASSVDNNTWETYDYAIESVRDGFYDYLGFVFADNGYVGIDIDTGYDEDGLISELAVDLINKCKSYTEKSKSGRGFHILLKGDLPFSGKNNLNGVEIYKSARFFIMTGNTFMYDKIVENQQAIDYIVDKYFNLPTKSHASASFTSDRIYTPIWGNPVSEGKIRLRPRYPKIDKGGRNICLTSIAGGLHNAYYRQEEIYRELQHINKIACVPPLSDRELKVISRSISRYAR